VRAAAAHFLIKKSACDVILSDDGLQHYALGRDIEIAVIDGERRFGNGYCLPAGPLREPVSRLNDADLVIVNGNRWYNGQFSFQLAGDSAINLRSSEHRPLSAFKGSGCHALAGIGNPQRFFNLLTSAGLTIIAHEFPDHFAFQHCDISFDDDLPVLMTEKDAVKCKAFASEQHWYVPVQARPNPDFAKQLINLLRDHHDR
jgi:tetraacyldisaccharide 4'-kinase